MKNRCRLTVSPPTELLAIFDEYTAVARKALATVKDEDLEKNWALRFGGQVVYQDTRRKVIRAFLNHLVHHRAQLGVYLRMNNIAVPGVYGPSADDR